MAHDDDLRLLGAADPLPGRLRDGLEDGGLIGPGGQRQRDAVARRLDLLDRMEPGRFDRGAEGPLGGGDLGIRGDDVDPLPGHRVTDRDQTRRQGSRIGADGHGTPRHVRAPTADHPPAAGQRKRPAAVVADQEAWPPAGGPAMLSPGERLVDVTAGLVDRRGVPIRQFVRTRVAEVQSAAP